MLIKKKYNLIYKIIFKTTNYLILNNYKYKICFFFNNIKIKYKIIKSKKLIKKYNVLTSPHIYNTSSETFKQYIYSLYFIININTYKQYINFFYFIKFNKYNIILNVNIKFILIYII